VRRPRGGWRAITFTSGRTQLAKLVALSRVLGRLGAATTVPLRTGCLLVAQTTPGPEADCPATLPRPGPVPARPQAPQRPLDPEMTSPDREALWRH
jgi:hypothetical protein